MQLQMTQSSPPISLTFRVIDFLLLFVLSLKSDLNIDESITPVRAKGSTMYNV